MSNPKSPQTSYSGLIIFSVLVLFSKKLSRNNWIYNKRYNFVSSNFSANDVGQDNGAEVEVITSAATDFEKRKLS